MPSNFYDPADATLVHNSYWQDVKADADKMRFLEENWSSEIEGLPLYEFLDKNALRIGGIGAALEYAMEVAAKEEAS